MSNQENRMHQLCWEIFGTDQKNELIQIAKKAEKYDLMIQSEKQKNVRNAGRKPQLSKSDVKQLIEMYRQEEPVSRIAAYFHISRQTVYKYLKTEKRFEMDPFITMRMNYMLDDEICTVIDVDFMHEEIYIDNKTDDMLHRAFGVIEQPNWKDFERFLEERSFPRTRAEIKDVLRDVGVTSYDPIQIVEKTQGRMAEDHQWIDIYYKKDVGKGTKI